MMIISLSTTVFSFIRRCISPPYCIRCYRILDDYNTLCKICYARLPRSAPYNDSLSPLSTITIYSFTHYEPMFHPLIQAKLRNNSLGTFQLSRLLCQYAHSITLNIDALVPIPLHWQRRMVRGFNQADILAHHVAAVLSKPVLYALKRHKKTKYQSELNSSDRVGNVADAFTLCVESSFIKGKRILIIDDIYTTGATVRAAAKKLYKAGAASVDVLVVCMVPPKKQE